MTMTDDHIGRELAIHEARAQPMLPMAPEDAGQVMRAYQDTCKAVLTRDDVQRVGDREFTTRSGFQKLAAAYGVSTEIVSLDVKGVGVEEDPMIARAVVRAIHPSGRHAEGDGACSSNERRFRRGDEKMDHSLPATAVTRATNRAVSNLVAFGTVSAEEAEGSLGAGGPAGVGPLPGWAAHMSDSSIPLVAQNLTRLLQLTGVDSPALLANAVGQEIFELCDGGFPHALARLAQRLVDAAETATQDETEVDGEAVDTTNDGKDAA